MNTNLKWMTVENPPGHKRLSKWKRSAAIDENGVVFAPAIICGNENAVFMCAIFDGEPYALIDCHPYFRTAWLKREYPDYADIMDIIESRMKEAQALTDKNA